MKKLVALSCLAVSIFCSCSDTQNNNTDNDLKKRDLKGNVKSIRENNFELLFEENEFRKGNKSSNSAPDLYMQFNEDGFVTQKKLFNIDGSTSTTYTYEYAKHNQLQKEIKYTAAETVDRVFVYSYEKNSIKPDSMTIITALGNKESAEKYFYENNDLVKQENFDSADKLTYFWEYKYDKNHNRIKNNWHVNNVVIQMLYNYDSQNRLIEQTEVNESNSKTQWQYEYDDKNNIIKEICIFSDGSQLAKDYKYEYDEKGNWITKFTFENNAPLFVTERVIEYY